MLGFALFLNMTSESVAVIWGWLTKTSLLMLCNSMPTVTVGLLISCTCKLAGVMFCASF
jgi:hypothetical protein